MKKTHLFLSLLALCLALAACKKDNDELPEFIDPADANLLSRVIILPDGAVRQNGDLPDPTGGSSAPIVTPTVTQILSSNGSTVPLTFTYSNVTGNLAGCFVQIDGANTFFNLPYTATSGTSGTLTVPITLPPNVLEGTFCVNFVITNEAGNVSNIVTTCVDVIVLGTGSLQITLSWTNGTDQDLHVTDPSGEIIYYANKTSSTGGQLDRDDTDGYGPENIYWLQNAPDGEYKVQVHDYDNNGLANQFFVTVNAPGKTRTFEGSTLNGSKVDVVTIRKNGTNYEF